MKVPLMRELAVRSLSVCVAVGDMSLALMLLPRASVCRVLVVLDDGLVLPVDRCM